ncbi:hypothetical protein MBLNU457_6593t2 [Dothideomycetes sp. NU457]
MIWHVLLHAIGVIFIIFFTFVNITVAVLDHGLPFLTATSTVLVEAVFALVNAIVEAFNVVFEAPHQVRTIRDNSRQLSPRDHSFSLHDDSHNHDFSEEYDDSDDDNDYNLQPASSRMPAPDPGRRPDSEPQRRISPRTLGPDGRVPGEEPPPFNLGPLFPTRRRTVNDGQRRRRGAIDHGRPAHFGTTTTHVHHEPSQPMDIPGPERGRRHTIPGGAPPNEDEFELLVRRPPRSPGPFELRSSPETASISRAYRQGQPLPMFRHRNEQSPSPTYVRLRTINTATAQPREAPRHVSDQAIIEQGDAVSDAGVAEGSTAGGPSRSHEAHQTAGAEANETGTGQSQEVAQEQTDTAMDLRRLAAVLNSRVPQQQDPEVRMVIDVPEPRDPVVPEERRQATEPEAAEVTPTVEVSPEPQTASESPASSEPKDGSTQPPTPQDTRDRRHMRATITQATQRRQRDSADTQETPATQPPSSGSTISERPFVRSNSPSPPSPPTPTPRPRGRSLLQRQTEADNDERNHDGIDEGDGGEAENTQDAPSRAGSVSGAGQDDEEAA